MRPTWQAPCLIDSRSGLQGKQAMKENLSILDAVGGEARDNAMERMILARE
jgi:hypothetical protein